MSLPSNYFNIVPEFGLSLIFFNAYIYVYLLYTFFCIIFLFNFSGFKTLNFLKSFGKLNTVTITIIMVLLSIAGVPPLSGFVGKFLIFNYLFFQQFYSYVVIFSFANFFALYFYLQCLRFMVSKDQVNIFLIFKNRVFLNKSIIVLLIILNIFNFFGILFLEDLLYWFFNLTLCKYNF